MPNRLKVVAVAILTLSVLVPLTPSAAAASGCEVRACRDTSLFAQPSPSAASTLARTTLSSLVGDAMPSGATRAAELNATTARLPTSIEIAEKGGFRIVLANANATSPAVNVSYRVDVVDLTGRATRIAHAQVRTDPAPSDPDRVRRLVLHDAADAAPAVAVVLGAAGQAADVATGPLQGNAAWNVVNITDEAACAPTDPAACRTLAGDFGDGRALHPCASEEPQASNGIFHWLLWYGLEAVDRREVFRPSNAHPLVEAVWPVPNIGFPLPTDEQVCRVPRDDLAGAAQAADVLRAPPVSDAAPLLNTSSNDSLPREPSWKDVTLDVDADAPLLRSNGFVVIPSGHRLVVTVDDTSRVVFGSPNESQSPIVFEYGRADARTALVLRSPTNGVFDMFADGAEMIGPGAHTGVLADPADVDDYAIQLEAGDTLNVSSVTSGYAVLVRDADGQERPSRSQATVDGRYHLRLSRATALPTSTGEYRFIVERLSASALDDRIVSAGVHEGELGAGDDSDRYTFFAWHNERFTVALATSGSLSARLVLEGARNAVTEGEVTRATASVDGPVMVTVARNWGEGGYALTLVIEEGGNLSDVPFMPTIHSFRSVSALTPSGDGVDLVARQGTSGNDSLYHVGPGSLVLERQIARSPSTARTASGAPIYRGSMDSIVIGLEDGREDPLLRASSAFAFGSDGRLYARPVGAGDGPRLARLDASRTLEVYAFPVNPELIVAAPDGSLLVGDVFGSGETYRFDPDTAAIELAADGLRGVRTFDAAGRGYRIAASDPVERYDPVTDEYRVVARVPQGERIDELAFAVDAMYAATSPWNGIGSASIRRIDLGVPGAGANHPGFVPPAAADLAIVALEDAQGDIVVGTDGVGEEHVVRVTIQNLGGTAAGETYLDFGSFCQIPCVDGESVRVSVPALAPSGSVVLEFPRRFSGPGERTVFAVVDQGLGVVLESDELTNNRADIKISVLAP